MTNYFFKGLLVLAALLITQSSIAQAPQKMSYQAVIRDVSNAAVINTTVGMRISILQGSAAGTSVYVETQTPMTNVVGLVTIEVGTGTVVAGIFSSINWSTGLYWIKTETDPSGGTSYSIIGIAQLLSVPFALHAGSSSGGWSLTGNSGTVDGTNFIGTTDDVPLTFKVNGVMAGKIYPYYSLGNTFLGGSAGLNHSNTIGANNSAFGRGAFALNVNGQDNTCVGVNSMLFNMGNGGTAIGFEALGSYSNAEGSVAVGYRALRGQLPVNNTGLQNTALGVNTLIDNASGGNNTATGFQALFTNTSGSNNTASGSNALTTNTTGSNNTAIGKGADVSLNNLTNATAIGYNANVGASNSLVLGGTGPNAVKVGIGLNIPTASLDILGNIKIVDGTQGTGKVLTSDATGLATWQTSSGSSGWSLTGNSGTVDGTHFIGTTDNVPLNFKVFGEKVGRIDRYGSLGNTFIGGAAGESHSTTVGEFNSAFGRGALFNNVNGSSNTSVGVNSLFYNLGNGATAIGFEAMGAYANAETNVAVGFRALRGNVVLFNNSGIHNTALGVNTLIDNSEGQNNTGSGYQALWTNSTGSNNTAMGSSALTSNTTGSNNTAIGSGADVAVGTLTNSTAIGANVIVDASNKVRIGNTAVTVIEGQVAYSFPSDARFKYNIQPNVPGLAFINKLKPVTYLFDGIKLANYTKTGLLNDNSNGFITAGYDETSKIVHTGFLAQDIEKICKEMGYEFDGLHKPTNSKDHYSLAYSQFIMPLVKGMQEQQLQIEEQKQINKQQNEKLQLLQKQIVELIQLVEKLK